MSKEISYKILGIDPGTNFLGYAIIETIKDPPKVLVLDIINLTKYKDQHIKLMHILQEIKILIEIHKPRQMAIEAPFYGKNVQSMLKLGRAQGVAIATALNMGLSIEEYSPKKIKQAITGNGNASKEQVAQMLKHLVDMNDLAYDKLDSTDALAVAICHYSQNKLLSSKTTKFNGWGDFVKNNSERLKTNKN